MSLRILVSRSREYFNCFAYTACVFKKARDSATGPWQLTGTCMKIKRHELQITYSLQLRGLTVLRDRRLNGNQLAHSLWVPATSTKRALCPDESKALDPFT